MGLFKSLSPVKTNRQQNVPIGSIRILAAAKNTAGSPEVTATANIATVESQAPIHRFSLRSSNFTQEVHNNALPAIEKREKPSNKVSNSDKRAKDSALALRSLIVGPTSTLTSQNFTTPNRSNIKSQLLAPKTASNVIAKLKELPASDDPLHADKKSGAKGLIHAVCLAYADAEADALHFSKLISSTGDTAELPSMVSAPVNKIVALFNDMHVIDLINAPDFGLGQPGDGPGILAGALPTAETVIEGVERITPELMALGYATGRAVMPDHSGISFHPHRILVYSDLNLLFLGIYPPTDRISVLTCKSNLIEVDASINLRLDWWGLELLLPSPSLIYVGVCGLHNEFT